MSKLDFHPKYTAARADDIAAGTDPALFAMTAAIKQVHSTVAVPAPSVVGSGKGDDKKKQKGGASNSVKDALELVAPLLHAAKPVAPSSAALKSQPVRRQRNQQAPPPSDPNSVLPLIDSLIAACQEKAASTTAINPNTDLPDCGGVLLSASELTRLQANATAHHTPAARLETHSVYDKVVDRLSRQRVDFVNSVLKRKT
jgi:hypothetical protein